ncbi:methyltransferase domain-containing protein [Geotalea toluenoxydans]|uniref:methyltransferase domain-containing protein n=1 Tax=Geotalea toluenoxydans TaxID=421624 RepID=UPI000A7F7DCB|nr:methyltransferase domain-containing protein [Geotalea toluenoxydans]
MQRIHINQFFPGKPLGQIINGVRCESLEELTFDDESIDLHVTQDVMEHMFTPSKAFAEIARTLKPGGAHVFTVPLVNKNRPSELRATFGKNGEAIFTKPPQYHGNPVSEEGSLVTVDWGYDICKHIFDACGLFTHIVRMDNLYLGIRADLIEVLMTIKPAESGDGSIQ